MDVAIDGVDWCSRLVLVCFSRDIFFQKISGKIGKVRKWKSSRVDGFFDDVSCQYVSTWQGGRQVGWKCCFAKNCQHSRNSGTEKGRYVVFLCIFWFWVVELKHLPTLSPTSLGCVKICGGRSVDHSGGSDESSKPHQVRRGVSLHRELLKAINSI